MIPLWGLDVSSESAITAFIMIIVLSSTTDTMLHIQPITKCHHHFLTKPRWQDVLKWKQRNNLVSSGFKTREYSLAWLLKLVVLLSYVPFMREPDFCGLLWLVILMEYRVDPGQQVLCISMGDVKQTSLDVMVTSVRFRSDVIRMKALCNHPKSNLGSCPFLIQLKNHPLGFFIRQVNAVDEAFLLLISFDAIGQNNCKCMSKHRQIVPPDLRWITSLNSFYTGNVLLVKCKIIIKLGWNFWN